MVFRLFKSYVDNVVPNHPALFVRRDNFEAKRTQSDGTSNGHSESQPTEAMDQELTMGKILKLEVPELFKGASYWCNPILTSGDVQTAYTALNEFNDIDQVYYKRRILLVDKDARYDMNGEMVKYDKWEGESTFAVDYVVGKDACGDANHVKYKPQSQVRHLPERTEYLDPAQEQQLLLDDSKPLLIALHGLSGGSHESYVRAVLHRIAGNNNHKFDALVLNSRGCARHSITSPQLFCGLWTNDLRYLVNEHIKKKWPNKRIYLIGFSLGAAICANYLGQEGDRVYENIAGAAVLGAPWDFIQSNAELHASLLGDKVYSPKMAQNLMKLVLTHSKDNRMLSTTKVVQEFVENKDQFRINKLKDFDDIFTSRLFGFPCATDYYRRASPIQRVLNIRVPLLILNAIDDPIVGSSCLPVDEVKLNPYTFMVTTSNGGHLGWFNHRGARWYADPVARFFQALDAYKVVKPGKSDLPPPVSEFGKYDRIMI